MFPSTISTFNQVSASDRLNSPSHSALHNNISSVLTQVQTVIGTNVTSAIGTIIGDLRNPTSDGGGHVQTAVKGGTGQTNFTKGDLVVATSPSVLSKLAVGSDGQNLVVDSSVASGIKWGQAAGSKIAVSASIITFIGSENPTPETSIISVTIPGSTLGASNAVKFTAFTRIGYLNANVSVLARMRYGGAVISSVLINPTANFTASAYGRIEGTIFANNSANLQLGILEMNTRRNNVNPGGQGGSVISFYDTNVSSVNSSANQTLGLTLTAAPNTEINFDGYIVEKIV